MIISFADFEFDDERFELRRGGRAVKTEAIALRVLAVLVARAGVVVTKDELIQEVWEGRAVADNVVTVAMARLRKALNTGSREHVLTVYGRGYRFVGPYSTREAPAAISLERAAAARVPPFVGRERVIERLQESLTEAVRGRGRLCVLMGEAGIGKTRVVEALEQHLPNAQIRIAWGFCREVGDTPPLFPWLRLLREVVSTSRSRTGTLAQTYAELSEMLRPVQEPPVGRGGETSRGVTLPNTERHRSFDLFTEAFAEAAEEGPLLLVLDDLHRADAASIELLSYLTDEIAHRRMLIVATLRHSPGRRSPRPETHLPYVLGHRNCERIAVERLRENDVATYVSALVDDADGELARAVFAKSEGNPFYMTELARQLASVDKPTPKELAIPNVALDLIRQRVAKLAPEPRSVLEAAAVIGRSFELSLLQAVTDEPANALMASVDEAIAADLVVAAPESTTAFAFGHDLLRAVLYDGLSAADKRRWHIRTAEAIERRIGVGDAVPPSELAYHLHAALPESDLRKTVSYCRAAAAAAGSVYAHSDVVHYLHNALQALNLMDNPSVRLRTSIWYVIGLYSQGHPWGLHAANEVIRLARDQGDAEMLARAAIMLNPYPGMKPAQGARAALENALDVLDQEQTALRAVTLAGISVTAPYCFDAEQANTRINEALTLARRSGSRAARYVGLVSKMHLDSGPEGDLSAGDELMALYRERPSPRMVLSPLYVELYRAVHALGRGDLERASHASNVGLSHALSIHHFLVWHFRRFQALLHITTGNLAKGIEGLLRQHADAEQRRYVWTEPYCAFDRIVVFPEATDGIPALDDTLRSPLDFDEADPPAVWALKVRALAAAGLHDEARASLRVVAPRELAALPVDSQYLGTLGHLAHAAVKLGQPDYAAAIFPLLEKYTEHFTAHFTFLCDSVPEVLSALAVALGRNDEAVDYAEAGLRSSERAGLVRSTLNARFQLATALLKRGLARDRAHAHALATSVQDEAGRLGLRMLARRATALLADKG